MDNFILYWPNNDWCFAYELEEFMQDNNLSDDYTKLDIPEFVWPEQVEHVVVEINDNSLDPKNIDWE